MSIEVPLHLPTYDKKYSMMHMCDKPFMMLPGEVKKEVCLKNKEYVVTNYCRIWSTRYNKFINSISGVNIRKVVQDMFTAEELDNEFSQNNIKSSCSYGHALYMKNREDKIAKQIEYNNKRKAEKQQYDKTYRIINKGGSILPL